MKLKTIVITVQLALLGVMIPGHAQELVTNGGFELNPVGTITLPIVGSLVPGSQTFGTGSTGISGWTVSSGSVSEVDAGGTLAASLGLLAPAAAGGNQYTVLNGINVSALGTVTIGGPGGLSQSLAGLTAGQNYQVSFLYAPVTANILTGTPSLTVTVSNTTSNTGPTAGLISVNLSGWQNETFNFVASGGASVLNFAETSSTGNAELVGLDNVSVMPVPEPAHYALAMLGFLSLLILTRIIRRPASAEDAGLVTA